MRTFPWRLGFLLVALAAPTAFLANCRTQWQASDRAATEPTAMAPPEATVLPAATTPTTSPADLSDVIVSGSAEGAPDGCTVETVAGRLLELADAVNNADAAAVPEFFGASDATFEWYCMHNDGESFTTYSLDELEAYFQQRYEQHERWRLESVQVNGWDQARRLLHFGPVVLSRTADDMESASEPLGKGAYSCEREEFVVLCLGEGP